MAITFKDYVNKYNIGIVGFSDETQYNKKEAIEYIKDAFDKISNYSNVKDKELFVVSGLTSMGIPKLAYDEAVKRKWNTVGISAKEAEQYDLFDVDIKIIIGEKFGDESEYFLNEIDVLVRIGGGPQSKKETSMAKNKNIHIIEYDFENKE